MSQDKCSINIVEGVIHPEVIYSHLRKMTGSHFMVSLTTMPPHFCLNQALLWKRIRLNNNSYSTYGTLPFPLFLIVIAENTTFLIILHK